MLTSFLPMIAIFVVFYFLLIRPQQKRAKETRELLAALEKGNEVITSGGLVGRIAKISDQYVTLEVATGVEVTVQRGAVSQLLAKARSGSRRACNESLSAVEVRRHRRCAADRRPVRAAESVPEVPAVQVSTSKGGVKVDTTTLATVESTLKVPASTYRGAALDATGIKMRFADADAQGKAQELLQEKLNSNPQDPDYIVALNLQSSSPQWLASIGALPMYLGLDLRGGVHFLLQVDMKAALDKAADRYIGDIRTLLRDREDPVLAASAARAAMSSCASATTASATRRASRSTSAYPDLADARRRRCRRRPAHLRDAQARGAEAHPGRRRAAEHPRSCATASTNSAWPSR